MGPQKPRELEFTLPIGYANGDAVPRRQGALRKMTGRDEAILADKANHRNGGRLVTELIHSCVTRFEGDEKLSKQDVGNWYSADRNYVLLKLRSFTFGPELDARYACPSCGEQIEVVENLDELPVRSLGPDGGRLLGHRQPLPHHPLADPAPRQRRERRCPAGAQEPVAGQERAAVAVHPHLRRHARAPGRGAGAAAAGGPDPHGPAAH
jgi:hypothetical protein